MAQFRTSTRCVYGRKEATITIFSNPHKRKIISNEITQFEFENLPVRIVDKDGSPWFVAKDVCDVLGLSNSRKAISKLDTDEKADVTIGYTSPSYPAQSRQVTAISESGLYALILRSKKPQAKVFRKWITSEVIPSIRRTGNYSFGRQEKEEPTSTTISVQGTVFSIPGGCPFVITRTDDGKMTMKVSIPSGRPKKGAISAGAAVQDAHENIPLLLFRVARIKLSSIDVFYSNSSS